MDINSYRKNHPFSQLRHNLNSRFNEFAPHINFIRGLKKAGLSFYTVLDIGANKGDWTKFVKSSVLRHSNFYLIEPNSKYSKTLSSYGQVFDCILSDTEKSVNFFQIDGTGDSYYKEVGKHYKDVTPKNMTTTTLDKLNLPPIDFIKLDTQGSELDILSGFEIGLTKTKALIIEVPIYEYNFGAPNFTDYVNFMNARNFAAVSVIDSHIVEGVLTQVDIGFLNRSVM